MITITVNGEQREVAEGMNVEQLLATLGLHPRLVVVEHNRARILDRQELGATNVADGDSFELVHFVGGG
jgi:thiamine biosynthesis protein ThiS